MTAVRREAHAMFHATRNVVSTALGVVLITMIGCAKPKSAETPAPAAPEPVAFKVSGLELGKQIDADKKVVAPMETFGPKDTIYVTISTEGATPGAKLSARWTYGEAAQLVNEMSETIAPTGPAATVFHITKAGGLPSGRYKV